MSEIVGIVPAAYHLWRGALSDRGYDDREQKLPDAGFNPLGEMALDAATGCWRWTTDAPALHAYVRGHIIFRRRETVKRVGLLTGRARRRLPPPPRSR